MQKNVMAPKVPFWKILLCSLKLTLISLIFTVSAQNISRDADVPEGLLSNYDFPRGCPLTNLPPG